MKQKTSQGGYPGFQAVPVYAVQPWYPSFGYSKTAIKGKAADVGTDQKRVQRDKKSIKKEMRWHYGSNPGRAYAGGWIFGIL